MATHRINILGFNSVPDSSGDVFFEPYTIKDTAAIIGPLVLIFNDSGNKDGIRGSFLVPENYVSGSTTKFRIYWTANSTDSTNGVVWDLSYLTRAAGEDMGAAATDTTDTVTDTHTGTAFQLNIADIDVTEADFASGDVVPFELFRDSPNDSFAAAVIVFAVAFEYADA